MKAAAVLRLPAFLSIKSYNPSHRARRDQAPRFRPLRQHAGQPLAPPVSRSHKVTIAVHASVATTPVNCTPS